MPYKWNEGVARAARHYLNDFGSCGTNGDKNAMGFSQILSAYYVWNYFDLEFEYIETDYFVNDEDWDESAEMGLAYILTQENINKDMFMYQHEKEMGIGCACLQDMYGKDTTACIIATVDRAPIRDIQERVPTYQKQLAEGEKCHERCEWLDSSFSLSDVFYTNATFCDEKSQYVDQSGFCQPCEDQLEFCSKCEAGVCTECQ